MLRVLKMGMRSMAAVWEIEFAEGGEEAVVMMDQNPFDVVVTDMRMPGMNGAQLLNHVLRQYPQTIRIVLSGYSDLSDIVKCIGLTHQFLEKPCSLEDLKDCLKRATLVKSRLTNNRLRKLTACLDRLPSLPELYLEIADALQSPITTAQNIADIAAKDPALSAQLLHLANSAFFGFRHKVFSVTEAVQLLGVNVIQSLALAVPIFSSFRRDKCPGFVIDHLWEHSAQTGALARRLFSQQTSDAHLAEQAFCAGLLHDIGKIILADGLPEDYSAVLKEARESCVPLLEVERKHLQATHAEVGGYLLAIWGLPMPLIEAVANHHCPRRCGTNELCVAGVVHIANALQHARSPQSEFAPSPLDTDYLKHVGLEQQFEIWKKELAA